MPVRLPSTCSQSEGKREGLAGLSNLGNTCFMNSSLQCLSHAAPLMRYFLTSRFLDDVNRTNLLGLKGELADGFASLLRSLWKVSREQWGMENKWMPRYLPVCCTAFGI